jgi:hypothetical protein
MIAGVSHNNMHKVGVKTAPMFFFFFFQKKNLQNQEFPKNSRYTDKHYIICTFIIYNKKSINLNLRKKKRHQLKNTHWRSFCAMNFKTSVITLKFGAEFARINDRLQSLGHALDVIEHHLLINRAPCRLHPRL